MKLKIYMKSGNVIALSGIEEYKIENTGNEITSLEITQKHKIFGVFPSTRLLVKTIALDQIEAVTRT
jgi:hypothetical protein